jgi:short subunit dehydrogenase-like uncharacterized protein
MSGAGVGLLYGATGYTGGLIARLSRDYGLRPILGGRNERALAALATELGLEHRTCTLADGAGLRRALDGVTAVLHCAGPFIHTSRPMADACLERGVHYLDITGEIDVLEALAARDAEARAAGIMLLPGAGFDVVPSDCLAAHLKRRLPGATRLRLGIRGSGRLSHGTALTMVENQDRGGAVRRNGQIVRVPAAWKTRDIDFGQGPTPAVTIPWGDVATAYHSTGIPDIEVYAALPALLRRALRASRYLGRLSRLPWVREFQRRRIRQRPAGPGARELAQGRSQVWGMVEDDQGRSAVSRLSGPNGYALTAHAALIILRHVLNAAPPPGFQTPSLAYGPDLVLEIPGITREDLAPAT